MSMFEKQEKFDHDTRSNDSEEDWQIEKVAIPRDDVTQSETVQTLADFVETKKVQKEDIEES